MNLMAENARASHWSATEVELLRKLWAGKILTKEISKKIGRPLGSVTAKAFRIKLPRRRMDGLRLYGSISFTQSTIDMIRINANALGIAKAEYIRRACERCPIEVVGQ